ncbi:uncharacterized protein CANTADRAFT_89915 [Suhomyces tanzawaensis NRRL Y-17324]|uniref:Zn(2)-C6 fungal-type domain-containing protein n=1 Tax=Suhomyces tanzawaensis NRRL Y-17324 TaxID=984487 RepID=A0A1E4SLG8_9ASCO|nr:uncharacterized protein CANTADRAFT_89915 [Suhomyces tanzawaensis NRRL Y-17324]ODV80359.1 hypothetical protein CANTADRAFT_89915 [Suhomyces tanzawaensis NRRL Y-17324]
MLEYSDPTSPPANNKQFRRNYRACLNCRVRKVKCDLGPVDNPRDGKCARCQRERKDCVFVESKRGGMGNVTIGRQKRKREDEAGDGFSPKSPTPELAPSPEPPVKRESGHTLAPSTTQARPVPLAASQQRLPSVTNILNQAQQTHQTHQNQLDQRVTPDLKQSPSNHFSTMEGALVFLAKAAGTIAKADERDNIDARAKHEQLEAQEKPASTPDPARLSTLSSVPPPAPAPSFRPSHVPPYMKPGHQGKRMTMPAAENGFAVRPKGSNKLSSIEYIGEPNGILSEAEAERLIHLFFTTMHPFFPHIPQFLHSPKVLSAYPILLCTILTISSRYHPFENNVGVNGGVPRNIEVHDRLWLYVQRLISQTVWAEASTRSIGTIFAFFLFTEWNPRAIHWRWSDYANKAEEANDEGMYAGAGAASNGTGLNGSNNPGKESDSEPNLAGLGAMRRSYRMAWMLIGSAVRLAQDMGFMEISSKTFLASHIAEINSVMNISRRSMLAHSLSEVDLDEDEISEEDMENVEDDDDRIMKMTEDDLKRIASEHILKFTLSQKAQIELLQIMSLGHESLYGYRAQLGGLTQRQNLSVLSIISPLINNWGRKYKHFLKPVNYNKLRNISNNYWLQPNSKTAKEIAELIEQESFVFEFNYVKLYIYSLALSPTPKVEGDKKNKRKSGKATLKLDEMSKSAKYIEQAFNAANEMLLVAHRIHKLKLLRYMPVRWLTRMVRAVAFIVKCYLTITAHKKSSKSTTNLLNSSIDDFDSTILSLSLITIDEIISSIQRAAITLRDCSPDELHLCTRYSNVLMFLCSEMKTTAKTFQDEEDDMNYKRRNFPVNLSNNVYASEPQSNYENTPQPKEPVYASNLESVPFMDHRDSSTSENITPSDQRSPLLGDNEVMDWFMNNRNVGLDFVGPWTEMIEQQLNLNDQFNFEDAL